VTTNKTFPRLIVIPPFRLQCGAHSAGRPHPGAKAANCYYATPERKNQVEQEKNTAPRKRNLKNLKKILAKWKRGVILE
jgi:hypothetical protein